jgi:radical SAM peptide maturase (CXXX-repeat target family)
MYTRNYTHTETFQDLIARLYPLTDLAPDVRERVLYDKDGNPIRYLARTVTFQVTDDCNLYCVPAGTMILMEDKTEKPIEEITIGDKILTFEEKPKQSYPKVFPTEVTALFNRVANDLYEISTEDHTITVTGNHPILTLSPIGIHEYKTADKIKKGDTIYKFSGNTNMVSTKVKDVKVKNESTIVYNLTTDLSTYVANGIGVHNCSYCYQINKKHHTMPFEVAKKFADMILESNKDNNDYITVESSPGIVFEFIGGEPFLEIDLISQISDYLVTRMQEMKHPWRNKFMFSICSNGMLYSSPKVQAYMEKYKYNLSFSISIDGNKELHDSCRVQKDGSGSYDIAIAGVEHFRQHYNGKMGSKMTMAPSNITYVFDAVKNLIELNYDEIFLNCVYEKGWDEDHAAELYIQFKKVTDYMVETGHFNDVYLSFFDDSGFRPMPESDNNNWCGGTGSMIAVDYKGDIYPCLRYMESSIGDEIEAPIIGTVDKGFMYNDKTKGIVNSLRKITRRSQSTDDCFYCPIAHQCSWCSAYNYQELGSANKRATYICIMHKSRVLSNIYYWNKGFKKYAPWFKFASWIPREFALEIIDDEEYDYLMSLVEFSDEDKELTRKMLDNNEVPDEYKQYAITALETNRPVYTNDLPAVYAKLDDNGNPVYDDENRDPMALFDNTEKVDATNKAYSRVLDYIDSKGFDIHAIHKMREYAGMAGDES